MTHTFRSTLRVVSVVTAFAIAMSATGFAADNGSSGSGTSLLSSGRAQVQQLAKTPAPQRSASAQQEGTRGYDEPRSFFSTKRGVALLVLAGAGIGYMWYSKSNDRIHSTARARLDN